MGEPQTGQVSMRGGETTQLVNHGSQPTGNQRERLPQENQIRVVRDETAGGSQMDDTSSRGTLVAISMHVSHYIVTQTTLVLIRHFEINLVHVSLHFCQLSWGNIKPQLLFRFRQHHPQSAPSAEFFSDRPRVPPSPMRRNGKSTGSDRCWHS
jgi:hypothetical protein